MSNAPARPRRPTHCRRGLRSNLLMADGWTDETAPPNQFFHNPSAIAPLLSITKCAEDNKQPWADGV
ncbi:hypothetical protein [Nodosilinea sp. E11]|uniref:hypothetical protein n=1 Tax=Nodosilinea sp. E11 TaxID=3037479 RepID=UPI002934FDED|nr:hypothetical protein [Nodosilinea sp. E11]WOD40642.1 hypothetical protein RRF56_07530 [Nodosilinea sp. E11]